MGMRITTNGVFQGYRSNLAKSYTKLNKSMTRVSTQRNFSAYSEDVSAASRAFQLRRSFWRADNQINNSNYVISKFETAWSAVDYIVDGNETESDLSGIVEALEGLQDTYGGSRVSLGQSIVSKAESIVRLMNVQYGDQFIFAGADGKNVPFSWGEDGTLLYRGVDVNTALDKTYSDFDLTAEPPEEFLSESAFDAKKTAAGDSGSTSSPGVAVGDTTHYYSITQSSTYDDYKTWYAGKTGDSAETVDNMAAYLKNQEDAAKLKSMAAETTYVDIGLGIKWDDNGEFVPSSAYNSALSGLNFLGYGTTVERDETGKITEEHSNNLVSLMMQVGKVLQNCDVNTGEYPEGWNTDNVSDLVTRLQGAIGQVSVQHVKLSGDTTYLNTNLDQLKTTRDQLNDQIIDIEQADAAGSIEEFAYARYSYNAALQVGSSILTNTLLDFLR